MPMPLDNAASGECALIFLYTIFFCIIYLCGLCGARRPGLIAFFFLNIWV
jgi:hypothetical protein